MIDRKTLEDLLEKVRTLEMDSAGSRDDIIHGSNEAYGNVISMIEDVLRADSKPMRNKMNEIVRLGKIALAEKKKNEKEERDFTKVVREQLIPTILREIKKVSVGSDSSVIVKVDKYQLEIKRVIIQSDKLVHGRVFWREGVNLKQAKLMKKIIQSDTPKISTKICKSIGFEFWFDSFPSFTFDNSGRVRH